MGCLYQLIFPNGKSYIGVTKMTALQRFYRHKSDALRGRFSCLVHRAIRKFGADSVAIKTLLVADWEYLLDIEPLAIRCYGTRGPNGYNMTDGGEGVRNLSAESRERIGAAQRGTTRSEEHRAAVSKAQKGRVHTEEHRAKVRAAVLGRKWTPEQIAQRVATRRANLKGAYFAS